MKYSYKVIPALKSIGVIKGKNFGESLAKWVEDAINKMSDDGWEFYRIDNFTAEELAGCIGSLFLGRTGNTENYNLLIFRKEIQ